MQDGPYSPGRMIEYEHEVVVDEISTATILSVTTPLEAPARAAPCTTKAAARPRSRPGLPDDGSRLGRRRQCGMPVRWALPPQVGQPVIVGSLVSIATSLPSSVPT